MMATFNRKADRAIVAASVANRFITDGLTLAVTPHLLGMGFGLALVMGFAGGRYPAWLSYRI
jgi:hypothetical protein